MGLITEGNQHIINLILEQRGITTEQIEESLEVITEILGGDERVLEWPVALALYILDETAQDVAVAVGSGTDVETMAGHIGMSLAAGIKMLQLWAMEHPWDNGNDTLGTTDWDKGDPSD